MCISILNIFISTRHVVTSTILLVCRGQWIHEIRGKIIWLDFFCMILFYVFSNSFFMRTFPIDDIIPNGKDAAN